MILKIKIFFVVFVKEYVGVYLYLGYGRVEFKVSKMLEGEDCMVVMFNWIFFSLFEL